MGDSKAVKKKAKAQTATERLGRVPEELKMIAVLAMREGNRDLAFRVLAFADKIEAGGKPEAPTATPLTISANL